MRLITHNNIQCAPVGVLLRCVMLALLLVAAACQTAPPVQEMSDARQAIAVARSAGAEKFAESDLKEAEMSLESAQRKLSEGFYSQARHYALNARGKALEALSIAEKAEAQQSK